MKRIFKTLVVLLVLVSTACGDAGIGFNVSKKVPVVFNISIQGNDPDIEVNPPAFTETFRLSDVGSFEDALSELAETDGVVVNSVSYAIAEVSAQEEIQIDQISLSVASTAAQQINVLNITGTLQNTPESPAGVGNEDTELIKDILTNFKEVENTLTFDFSEVPASDLDFVFTLYYDITLRVRF